MIITFSVQNFRSIREKICLDMRATSDKTLSDYYVFEIERPKLRVLKMAMLCGLNASGKTNVLLALDYLKNFIMKTEENKEKLIETTPFALNKNKPTLFEIQFYYDKIVYKYILELNQRGILYEKLSHYPKGREAFVFERRLVSGIDNYDYSWTGAELLIEQRKMLELTIQNQSILSKIATIKYSGPLQLARDWFRDTLAPIVRPKTSIIDFNIEKYLDKKEENKGKDCDHLSFFKEQLKEADFMIDDIKLEKEIVDFDLSKLSSEERRIIEGKVKKADDSNILKLNLVDIILSHSTKRSSFPLKLSEESEGTIRYFEFIGLLCELVLYNRIVPIDELESSLHPHLQTHFLVMFLRNSKQGQLIFTSHNIGLLNDRDIIRRDAVWITDRKDDGSTSLTNVSDYSLRKEHAIDRVYSRGLLGGIPNLGSTLIEVTNE